MSFAEAAARRDQNVTVISVSFLMLVGVVSDILFLLHVISAHVVTFHAAVEVLTAAPEGSNVDTHFPSPVALSMYSTVIHVLLLLILSVLAVRNSSVTVFVDGSSVYIFPDNILTGF